MTYTASYGIGPGTTPKIIRNLIIATCILSVFCALVNVLFVYYLQVQSPQALLSLSWSGLKQGYIWQPVSYFFVQSSGGSGISFSFFLELFFNMYVLWIIGSNTVETVGSSAFVRFYLIVGALVGLATILTAPLVQGYTTIAGSTPPVLATLFVWAMMHPESELQFFFLLPIKAKWLIAAIFGFFLLSSLSRLDFATLILTTYSFMFAYFYATTIWRLETPFEWTHFIDRIFIAIGRKIRSLFSSVENDDFSADKKRKIIDFHTGKPLIDDDNFMDNALEKISKHGEKSLSWSERNRMKKISEKKAKQKNNNKL